MALRCRHAGLALCSERARAFPAAVGSIAAPPCRVLRSRHIPTAAPKQRLRHVGVAAAMSSSDEAIRVVQRQLEAYNARDLEPFMAVFDDDVQALDLETGAVIASSAAQLRPRYMERFKTPVHCELISRVACGDTVVDRERITGLPGGASADCMAVYTVKGAKIVRMQLLWKAQ